MIFEKILGNEKNKHFLEEIVNKSNTSHSYMFIGKSSIGKKLFAKEFAKAILCEGEAEKPCDHCISCIKFNNNNHPDFYLLEVEDMSIKNEQIREINKKILEKPIESTKKVYIIDNSELMTIQAQNTLLKTLEEPPEYATIILITNNENLMLNTIKSRCIKIYFNELKENEILSILKEKYGYTDISSKMIEHAEGSIEKAIKIYTNLELYNQIEETFTNIEKIDIIDFLNQKDKIFKNRDKTEINEILEYINVILYNLSKTNDKYLDCIKIVEQSKERLKKNSNEGMTLDSLFFSVWGELND